MAKGKEVAVVVEDTPNAVMSFDNVPDYLKDQKSAGLESLGQGDFKVPRILLLQALSPAVASFPGKAIPGEFWHTGANKSLGTEFNFIPCIANKRVIVWKPREDGGGMLAFSRDGKTWDMGGDTKHSVKQKGVKNPVIWDTGKNVAVSKLLEWGTYNPDDPESGPAATLSYEYLLYLPEFPELSPVVHGVYRTGLNNAKQFNTSLAMLRKPIAAVQVRAFSDEETKGTDSWFVTNFEPKGWTSPENFKIATDYAEAHKNYNAEYDQAEVASTEVATDSDQY